MHVNIKEQKANSAKPSQPSKQGKDEYAPKKIDNFQFICRFLSQHYQQYKYLIKQQSAFGKLMGAYCRGATQRVERCVAEK